MLQSILGGNKIRVIQDSLRKVRHLPGDIAELGVYKGGTAWHMHTECPEKRLWLFDTFKGMPEHSEIDKHKTGEFRDIDLKSIQDAFQGKDVVFRIGMFPETAPTELVQFCFVHLDADQYTTTKIAIDWFYDRLVPGGIMVFDDYKWSYCPGVEKAINEFIARRPEVTVQDGAKFQAVIIK